MLGLLWIIPVDALSVITSKREDVILALIWHFELAWAVGSGVSNIIKTVKCNLGSIVQLFLDMASSMLRDNSA